MNFNNTNWHLYKTFIVVYETGNLHKASEILYISRSGVSHNLKELSGQLGTTLFTAHSKGVAPTSEANEIYPIIKNAIISIVEAENNLQSFNSESVGTIKMAMTASHVELYAEYMKEFCTKYPKVKLELFERNSIDLLEQGKIDFILATEKFFSNTELKTINISHVSSIFIASKEFLSKNSLSQSVTKNELLNLPIIAHRDTWTEFCKDNKIDILPFVFKTASSDMTYSMTKRAIGVGYYFKELLSNNEQSIIALYTKDVVLPIAKTSCGYKNNLSKPAKAFIDGLIEYCVVRHK